MKNTLESDINEIALCVKLVDGDWQRITDADDVQEQYERRAREVDRNKVELQIGRAESMAFMARGWAMCQGYGTEIEKSWWTARPGALTEAIGVEIDSKHNPTDVLCHFEDAGFLGISAKSTGRSEELQFNTGGLQEIDKFLGIDTFKTNKSYERAAVKELSLPSTQEPRGEAIKASDELRRAVYVRGCEAQKEVREKLLSAYQSLRLEDLRKHLLIKWMRVGSLDPPYVKVTGYGKKEPFKASVISPYTNDKVDALYKADTITFHRIGDTAIGVAADGMRIMQLRQKYESKPLASSLKIHGEDW